MTSLVASKRTSTRTGTAFGRQVAAAKSAPFRFNVDSPFFLTQPGKREKSHSSLNLALNRKLVSYEGSESLGGALVS